MSVPSALRQAVPEGIKELVRRRDAAYREVARIRRLPRNSPGVTDLVGTPVQFSHAASFLAQYQGIFVDRDYDFRCSREPCIVDGGANIGMALLFWKTKWPRARVTAFEADPKIAAIARANLDSAGIRDVDLIEAALSDQEGSVSFSPDGSVGGRVSTSGVIGVPAVRLSPYLTGGSVDLLKLDIEGAETVVLMEAEHQLEAVKRIFVEYHSMIGERQTLVELLTILRDNGFRVAIRHERAPLRPFLGFDETAPGMDLQLNIWAARA